MPVYECEILDKNIAMQIYVHELNYCKCDWKLSYFKRLRKI